MNLLTDMHCHSLNSFDAESTVDEMLSAACEKELYAVCVTDHCDLYAPGENKNSECFDGDPIPRIVKSANETAAFCKAHPGGTKILKGVELGQATQDEKKARDVLAAADYDFVLGSLHNLNKEQDFFFMEFDRLDINDILTRYFCELIDACRLGLFDSLAHIAYPLRYIVGKYKLKADISAYKKYIDEILTMLIKSSKALEFNTSPIRNKIDVMHIDEAVFARYKQLGGELVTVGSDAHDPRDIAADIPLAYKTLLSLGFERVAVYEKRRPHFINISV